MVHKICVIGAGIIGMSTAVALQEKILDCEVVIMSAEFSPRLTSDMAAGLIEPYLSPEDEESVKLLVNVNIHANELALMTLLSRWCRETMEHIRQYMKDVPNGGAQEMSGYRFSKDPNLPSWISLMNNVHILSSAEMKRKHQHPQGCGMFYTTLYLEPTKYIQYTTRRFLKNGGLLVRKMVENFESIGTEYDCLVNCTGLEALKLVDDKFLHPVRGQIIRVRCPAVKHFFIDDTSYVLLNDDCVILGGTADRNCWDCSVNSQIAQRIMETTQANMPALKECEILSHHVGLRPGRNNVRLELEQRRIGEKEVPIVHNYGHGGSGITLFWGCALDTVELVKKLLERKRSSKL